MKYNTCPTCGSSKTDLQPEPINGRQDIFYICRGAVTYSMEDEDDFEETGDCENKINWDNILIEYGGEFDENAKLIDVRFHGWLELEFYKSAHSLEWFSEHIGESPLDEKYLDEYFNNKEMYLKKFRNFKGEVDGLEISNLQSRDKEIIVKQYYGDVWLGELALEKIDRFELDGFEKIIFKVVNSKDEPKRIGGYVIENNQIGGGDSSVDFYDREIIELILRNEVI